MKLTHHHATTSPFYDPTQSIEDLADFDLTTSLLRASYLLGNNATLQPDDLISKMVSWKRGGFLVNLQVGSQSVNQYVFMDTGSSFLWINCEPCNYNVPGPIFHPKESTTYMTEDCVATDECLAPGSVGLKCPNDPDDDQDACSYEVSYADGTRSKGELARDDFRFAGSPNMVLHSVVFGCSHETNLFGNGILGLGNNAFSILQQRDYKKFSYCIGNITDRNFPYHKLIISDRFNITPSKETPLTVENRYYINLVSITIGNTKLDIDPRMLRRNPSDYTGGMAVDSGSTYTFFPQVVYDKFEAVVRDLITGENYFAPERNDSIPYKGQFPRLCYNGDVIRDLDLFPEVKLEFEGGAVLELIPENMFHQVTDVSFCLGVLPIDYVGGKGSTLSILGNLMQQYLYVAFDLDKSKFLFQDMACALVN